jgi:uncharacterized caspase-like protein
MPEASKRAVIIGVNTYDDERIPNLQGARNDAEEMYARLTKDAEFSIRPSHYLKDSEATGDAIRRAISDVLWKTERTDVTLVYFSGHGLQDAYGNGFLAPADMIYDEPLVRGFRMQELRDLMLRAKNKDVVLLVLDSCYSGIATGGEKGPAMAEALATSFSDMPDEVPGDAKGRMILASSGATEKSRELHGCQHRLGAGLPHDHGMFTFQLLEGLDGRAADAKTNTITLGALHTYVESRFAESATEQRLEFFGAGVRNADSVVLAEAFEQQSLSKALSDVHDSLAGDKPPSVWYAIQRLNDIITNSPRLDETNQLRDEIDTKLEAYRWKATVALMPKKTDLSMQCPELFGWLEGALPDLSFDALCAEIPERQALLLSWVQYANEELAYKTFLAQMSALESSGSPKTLRKKRPTK